MRTESSLLLLAAILVPSMAGAQVEHADRSKEGNWSIMDQTDNNTGDREVWAMLTHYEPPDRDFVNLFIKCTDGRPTLSFSWHEATFPDQAVVSIGSIADSDAQLEDTQFVFAKVKDTVLGDYRATPKVSAEIVAAIGTADYTSIIVHGYGEKMIGANVSGLPGAWRRVLRHCPVKKLPLPPL